MADKVLPNDHTISTATCMQDLRLAQEQHQQQARSSNFDNNILNLPPSVPTTKFKKGNLKHKSKTLFVLLNCLQKIYCLIINGLFLLTIFLKKAITCYFLFI